MLKADELTNPLSCINKAAPDEPVFVLRAKDPCAAYAVRMWANIANQGSHHEPEKIATARMWADVMAEYAQKHGAPVAPATNPALNPRAAWPFPKGRA